MTHIELLQEIRKIRKDAVEALWAFHHRQASQEGGRNAITEFSSVEDYAGSLEIRLAEACSMVRASGDLSEREKAALDAYLELSKAVTPSDVS